MCGMGRRWQGAKRSGRGGGGGGLCGGGEQIKKNRQMQTRGNALHSQAQMHLSSLCQAWLNLKTHTVSETERQNIMSDYISQTITVSSCQSDISNQCQIKTPCITGMAEKSNPPLAGWLLLPAGWFVRGGGGGG